MKLSLLLSFLSAAVVAANPFAPAQSENSAKAEFHSRLLSRATPIRQLANANTDLTAYSLIFKRCQFVKTYSDTLAYDGSSTVLATSRFVIFRLCPTAASCNTNYGEYIIDLYDYLYTTVAYQKTEQTNNCTTCSSSCSSYVTDDKVATNQAAAVAADDGNVGQAGRYLASSSSSSSTSATAKACKKCLDECKFIANYANEGYYDAADFIVCTKIYDDGTNVYYAGPMCSNSGSKIKIGVFTDNTCYDLVSSKNPDDYLKSNAGASMKLSYHLLKEAHSSTPISCSYTYNGATSTSQFCTTLYDKAAKCETPNNFASATPDAESDTLVCNYISSLQAGTYSESGQINISGASSIANGGAKTSVGQKFFLTFFILGTVGLAVYAAVLHSKLTKGGSAKADLGAGAMA